MKKNPQIIALNLAADQCRRLSDFLESFSAEIAERPAKAITAKEAKKQNEEIAAFLFELSNCVAITAQGCQLAAAPEVPAPKVRK